MPIIRRVTAEFITNWNNHTIKKQTKKPHIIAGKLLNTFYTRPPERFYNFQLPANPELLGYLINPIIEWGKQRVFYL